VFEADVFELESVAANFISTEYSAYQDASCRFMTQPTPSALVGNGYTVCSVKKAISRYCLSSPSAQILQLLRLTSGFVKIRWLFK
jgi:hypothetical protein